MPRIADMAKRALVKDYDQFIVRLPPGMRDRVAAAARACDRSMNAEIVARLEESFVDEMYAEDETGGPKISAAEEFPPLSAEEIEEMDRWNEAYMLARKLKMLIGRSVKSRKRES
jgi:hypothetical protein